MKILKNTIKETNLGFPSEFAAKTEDGKDVSLSYRYGFVKIFVEDKIQDTIDGPEGSFDVGGSCTVEQLVNVLIREELLCQQEDTEKDPS